MRVRKLFDVLIVISHSAKMETYKNISEFIRVTSHLHAKYADGSSQPHLSIDFTLKGTKERNHGPVNSAPKLSYIKKVGQLTCDDTEVTALLFASLIFVKKDLRSYGL